MASTGVQKLDKRVAAAKQRKKWHLNVNAEDNNFAFAA